MEHPPSPADFQDFSAINFSNDYSLNYPSYEYHNNMSSPRLGFNSLNLSNSNLPYYSSSSANSPSPYIHASPVISSSTSLNFQPGSINTSTTNTCRPFSPSQSISPPLTNLSASDLSADSLAGPAPFALGAININGTHHSHTGRARAMSSGTGSPSSSYASAGSLTGLGGIGPHRNVKSYNVAAIVGREKRRRNNLSISKREDDDDDDEDDEDINPSGILPSSEVVVAKRREEIRRQRIESEQRRRDELRDGYRKLKEVLPISNQKSSKVSLLDRATTHIRYLELTTNQMAQKVAELEAETARLRQVNETLMLSAAERSRLGSAF